MTHPIFGELADVMLQTLKADIAPSERGVVLRPVVLEYLATSWRLPDEGISGMRGGPQHFVRSKVMAWVAFDRAANEGEVDAYHDLAQRCCELADETHAE